MSHFDRERIPERVVHARGATAFGEFEATGKVGDEPISKFTRAKLFQEAGKKTELAIRFSTVAGGRDSSEAIRDPRGFAVKFYTEDGNWDLVGNNIGVFFIRDAIKFPDFIHSQKPDPVTFERQVPNRVFDFISQSPESMHMVTLIFGPRGVPASYRTMQGFGVNTYKWVNEAGETVLVKYHWHPKQGVKSWTEDDAGVMQGRELGVHTKDLYEAIERRRPPAVGPVRAAHERRGPPRAGLRPARRHEDVAGERVPAAPRGDDDAQPHPGELLRRERADRVRHRRARRRAGLLRRQDARRPDVLLQRHPALPGRPELPAAAGQRAQERPPAHQPARQPDDLLRRRPRREPERQLRAVDHRRPGRGAEARRTIEQGPRSTGQRHAQRRSRCTNDYQQAGERYQLSEQWEKDDLVANLTTLLGECDRPIQERMVWHLFLCDDELGQRIGDGLGISAADVKHLKPVPTQGWSDIEQARLDNLGNNGPRDVEGLEMTHCVPNEHAEVAAGV